LKKALIIESKSSSSQFKNGGTIRQKTIESVLRFEGYEVNYLKSGNFSEKTSWDVIVILSLRNFYLARKVKKSNTKIWLDLCDSWVYSRFSLTTGPRLFFIGLFEIMVLLTYRSVFSSCLVTYISPLDIKLDRNFLRLLLVKQVSVLRNNFNLGNVRLNPSSKKRLVFFGDGNYFPNVLAALELSLRISRSFKKYKISEPIQIYGGNWPKWIGLLPNIQLKGFQAEDDLYSLGDIHLAPMRQKAGIKNKIEIPISLGLPVVAFAQSINGIPESPNLYSCSSKRAFLISISRAFENQNNMSSDSINVGSRFNVDSVIVEWLHPLELSGN
jgi:hypothetical protein